MLMLMLGLALMMMLSPAMLLLLTLTATIMMTLATASFPTLAVLSSTFDALSFLLWTALALWPPTSVTVSAALLSTCALPFLTVTALSTFGAAVLERIASHIFYRLKLRIVPRGFHS